MKLSDRVFLALAKLTTLSSKDHMITDNSGDAVELKWSIG